MRSFRTAAGVAVLAFVLASFAGCRTGARTVPPPPPARPAAGAVEIPAVPAAPASVGANLVRMGFTVQVGAFSVVDNARALAGALTAVGLDAFFFPAASGLYKVRFGDFPTRDAAVREAGRLRGEGLIGDYFVVGPESYAVAKPGPSAGVLRDSLAATAESFIGMDYSWGGTTSRTGFDCSGLVRAVYQLNGLDVPRSVADQYRAGEAVSGSGLRKGDLVFFSASPGGERTHVGIYVGDNAFIHAPGRGKKVRRESLGSAYFGSRYSGARTYLRPGPPSAR